MVNRCLFDVVNFKHNQKYYEKNETQSTTHENTEQILDFITTAKVM